MKTITGLLVSTVLFGITAHAQTTSFTYQGRLNSSGTPANGVYDLQFTIYDAVTNGTALGVLTNASTSVSNGLFTVKLDFGSVVFNGNDRWLDIGVRTNGSVASYVTLSPRQPVTSSPYAVRSANAAVAANVTGMISDAQLSANIARLNATNQVFSGLVNYSNPSNTFAGTFSGNASGLTNLTASGVNLDDLLDSQSPFTLQSSINVGPSHIISVISVDVNSDGKRDVALLNDSGTVMVWTNNLSGNFALSFSRSVSSSSTAIVSADLNGDGNPDLVTAGTSSSTNVCVLINNGNGSSFTASFSAVPGTYGLTLADVNGDGKPDLITANAVTNTLSVLTNNGTGSFVLSSTPTVASIPQSVLAVDVNGDGKPDLVSGNNTGTFVTLTNSGSGAFVLSSTTGTGQLSRSLTSADVNGDGKPDVIAANQSSATLSILTNNGTGGLVLAASAAPGASTFGVISADVIGDGKPELICAGASTLFVLTNNGSANFATAFSLPVLGALSVAAGDINGDGKSDLVGGGFSLAVYVRENNCVVHWGSSTLDPSQGGSIELGDSALTNANPFIDFHFGTGSTQDYNVRLINDASNLLSVLGDFRVTGTVSGNGSGLTNLNATTITSGTIADARLSTNVLIKGANSRVDGGPFYSSGSIGQYNFDDRTAGSSVQWSLYANNGRAYLWNAQGNSNRLSLDLSGNLRTAGAIFSGTTPDLAETISAADDVEAGDVVCADPDKRESVIRCGIGHRGVLGVISDGTSGFIINAYRKSVEGALSGKPLVLAGRVPVKVSLENGPVRIGDSLTPSSIPGVAMRSNGNGPTVGIALDNFNGNAKEGSAEGKVLCFVKVSERDARIEQLQERVSQLEQIVRQLSEKSPDHQGTR